MGKYHDLTFEGKHMVFGRNFYPNKPRKMDTYNLWSVSNKNYNRVVEEFGEDDAKTIVDVVNKTYELLFDDGPLTLEEQVIELESYENSYLYTVINDDHGVFVAATVDDTIYMVLMGFKTGSKDKFGKRFEEFRESLHTF